jgi:hypothetical protein
MEVSEQKKSKKYELDEDGFIIVAENVPITIVGEISPIHTSEEKTEE